MKQFVYNASIPVRLLATEKEVWDVNDWEVRNGNRPKWRIGEHCWLHERAELPPEKNQFDDLNAKLAVSSRQVGGTHYANKKIQPWDAMEAWMTREQFSGFLIGNGIKYLARANDKGGLEDIKKAQHYIEKLIEFLEKSKP